MHDLLFNIISALAVGILIGLMAGVYDPRKKALIYSLPIPITIALVATHGRITSFHVIGLVLLCTYLAAVHKLHTTLKVSVLTSDIVSTLAYLGIGYTAVRIIHITFVTSCCLYLVGWLIAMYILRHRPAKQNAVNPSAISPVSKGIITSGVALILFSLKSLLPGVVVTFPFSGVFAVIESRHNLQTLFRVVVRNSIAILGLFVTMYFCQAALTFLPSLMIGWVVFLIILKLVQYYRV